VRGFVTLVTITPERALQIDAVAVLAQVRVGSALVDVSAVVCQPDLGVALGTDAHERTNQILALELAIVGWGDALVHVYNLSGDNCSENETNKPWQCLPSGARAYP
jgi:hypothetical protein